jgi:hypothetical protein
MAVGLPAVIFVEMRNATLRAQSEARKAAIIEKFVAQDIRDCYRNSDTVKVLKVADVEAKRVSDPRKRPGLWEAMSIATIAIAGTPEIRPQTLQVAFTTALIFDSSARCTVCSLEGVGITSGFKFRKNPGPSEWAEDFRKEIVDAWLAEVKAIDPSITPVQRVKRVDEIRKAMAARYNVGEIEIQDIVGNID